jgi:hypothetical protein
MTVRNCCFEYFMVLSWPGSIWNKILINVAFSETSPALNEFTVCSIWQLSEIWGSHSYVYEDGCLLGCSTGQSGGYWLVFQRSLLLASSGWFIRLHCTASQKTVIFHFTPGLHIQSWMRCGEWWVGKDWAGLIMDYFKVLSWLHIYRVTPWG